MSSISILLHSECERCSISCADILQICQVHIGVHDSKLDRLLPYDILSLMSLRFFASRSLSGPDLTRRDLITLDHISILCADITIEPFTTAEGQYTTIQRAIAYPWDEIAVICAAQAGFVRLQLRFRSRADLLEFMEVWRTSLDKLEGRVSLFYGYDNFGEAEYAVDFHTMEDLGGASMLLFQRIL